MYSIELWNTSSILSNLHYFQELSPTTDANLTRSLMNIHESLLDEFKDEAKFNQLGLTDEQKEAWIMVSLTSGNALTVRLHHTTVCMDEQFVVIDTVNSFGIRTSFLTENYILLVNSLRIVNFLNLPSRCMFISPKHTRGHFCLAWCGPLEAVWESKAGRPSTYS